MRKLSVAVSIMVAAVCASIETATSATPPAPLPDPTIPSVLPVQVTVDQLAPVTDGQVEGSRPGPYSKGTFCNSIGWGNGQMASQYGTWPYDRHVIEWRQWCFNYAGGPQTYRYSEVHIYGDLCSNHDRYQHKVAGGNGFTYTDVETGSNFDCNLPTPPWTIHVDDWQIWHCTTSMILGCTRIGKGGG